MPSGDADTLGPRAFHRRLAGYRATVLVELDLGPLDGVDRVVIKLETQRYGLPSFKALGASWAGHRAVVRWLARGDGTDDPRDFDDLDALRRSLSGSTVGPTLVAATDGNHGRAVAWTARQLGVNAEIFVPKDTADGRVAAIASEGAAVRRVPGDYDDAVAVAAATAGPDRLLVQDTSVPGHEQAAADVVDGYATIFGELDEQLGPGADGLVLVVPVGVGSLALAATRYLHGRPGTGSLATVEPVEAASLKRSIEIGRPATMPGPHATAMVGLRCGTISAEAWPELRDGVDTALSVTDDEADAAMRELAERGIEVGECGAAPLAGLRQLISAGWVPNLSKAGQATIILIATEGPTDHARWRRVVGREPDASRGVTPRCARPR